MVQLLFLLRIELRAGALATSWAEAGLCIKQRSSSAIGVQQHNRRDSMLYISVQRNLNCDVPTPLRSHHVPLTLQNLMTGTLHQDMTPRRSRG